jgi:nucleotide-binding universal stress UspA family protein
LSKSVLLRDCCTVETRPFSTHFGGFFLPFQSAASKPTAPRRSLRIARNVEPHPFPWQTHGVEPETIQEPLAARAHIAVAPVLRAFQETEVTHHCHTKLGDTAQTIIASADEIGCDMIAMGSRSLASLTRGLVTNKVLHQAKVPGDLHQGQGRMRQAQKARYVTAS